MTKVKLMSTNTSTRTEPAIDVEISELQEGRYRVRLIGFIVNAGDNYISINDGSGQLHLFVNLDSYNIDDFQIGHAGRFIADVSKTADEISGRLVAWVQIQGDAKDLIKKYRRLVQIERRIPK